MKHISVFLPNALLFLSFFVPLHIPETTYASENVLTGSEMIITSSGPLRFYLTQPDESRVGSWGYDYNLEHSKLADFSLHHDQQSVLIKDPDPGVYSMEMDYRFTGVHTGTLTITYVNASEEQFIHKEVDIVVQNGTHPSYQFILDDSDTQVLEFDNSFSSPRGLQAFPNDQQKTSLNWQDPVSSQQVHRYQIWAQSDNAVNDIYLIGESSDLRFDTDILWNQGLPDEYIASPYSSFAVSAVFENGEQSILSDFVSNNDRDSDGLSDDFEEDIGTNPDDYDSDQDGLSDAEEYFRYRTDPNKSDSDDDGIHDKEEVNSDTNPHGHDDSYITSCKPPPDGDWIVTESCVLKESAQIFGNLKLLEDISLVLLPETILVLTGANSRLYLSSGAQ